MDETSEARGGCSCGRGASRRLVQSDATELATRSGLFSGQFGVSAAAAAGTLPAGVAFAVFMTVREFETGGSDLLTDIVALALGGLAFVVARSLAPRTGRVTHARIVEERRTDPEALWECVEWTDPTVTSRGGSIEISHPDCEFPAVLVDVNECAPVAAAILRGPLEPGSRLRLLRCPVTGWVTGGRWVRDASASNAARARQAVRRPQSEAARG